MGEAKCRLLDGSEHKPSYRNKLMRHINRVFPSCTGQSRRSGQTHSGQGRRHSSSTFRKSPLARFFLGSADDEDEYDTDGGLV